MAKPAPLPEHTAPGDGFARGLLGRYAAARARRTPWESLWQDCYDHALPLAAAVNGQNDAGTRRGDRLFDGTAPDAVDQLAASLLSQLTPPWSRWFALTPGPDMAAAERDRLAPALNKITTVAQAHFDHSNFAIEMHQACLELVTAGTASLMIEEAAPGASSSLAFTAVPLAELALAEGVDGRLDTTFRRHDLTLDRLLARFPHAAVPEDLRTAAVRDPQRTVVVIEAVEPDGPAFRYAVVLDDGGGGGEGTVVLSEGRFGASPFINFRWLKAPGETYGRSPVMKALPDIKTANKVVELVLKNASIAVTGMWQADDDGVLNPATIRLRPGAIIPKAVGSAGLTPLASPGRFDVSQLVLQDLRSRIRHALLVDRLGAIGDARMTATEVLERSAEMARMLGATYGRLQSELLTPLVLRGLAILRRRGEIPDVPVDGRLIRIQYRSPLAQAQANRDVQATLRWLEVVTALGPQATATIDAAATARWLGDAFGVPAALMTSLPPPVPLPVTVAAKQVEAGHA
ncbi:Phage tail protein [uncultured Gammaproteobacteria bacterium]